MVPPLIDILKLLDIPDIDSESRKQRSEEQATQKQQQQLATQYEWFAVSSSKKLAKN